MGVRIMYQKTQSILQRWLEIDFYSVASKAGFIMKSSSVNKKLIGDTIRCLDYLSTMKQDNKSTNFIITLIALMWTHTDHEIYDLRSIIVKFLSRIGYPTSAIIVDDLFDKKKCIFTPLNSLLDQITVGLNQTKNEVIVNGHSYLLTKFQKQIWDTMDEKKVIGISAPTSAGKSFAICLKVIQKLSQSIYDIVYIVPTLSLLNQVTEDFHELLKEMHIENCKISNTFSGSLDNDLNYIYVMTQEKAISAFANEERAFSKKMILVADEIQNIERIKEDTDERSKILFDTLMEFRYKDNVEQVIISGPRIEEIDKLGESIFGIETEDISTDISPVLSLTYSICKIGNKYFLKQYCMLNSEPICKEIANPEIIVGYGKKLYDNQYLDYLSYFLESVGKNEQNIIFAPTAPTARKIADYLSQHKNDARENTDLIQYYNDTVHENYTLCKTLKNGIAYHHGKLPMHVRRTLEKAIVERKINNVVCTTTLMQGVNMPAQNVIIRNPHLYLKKTESSVELSNYEMANLRGRAGRLLKDFIGRTYVLDESAFANADGYDQLELFDDVTKELPSGYSDRFEEYREDIEDVIWTDKPVDRTMKKYGYLVSYIRQSVLRYGKASRQKMKDVGIKLTQKQVAAIILKLEALTIPKEICIKNRYWDPFVLQKIFEDYTEDVPVTPYERGAKRKLDRMLKYMRDTEETSAMYERYIPMGLQNGPYRGYLVSLCMKWAQEIPLHDILCDERYSGDAGADEIEKTIQVLQNVVSFNIPLLLKPIFDIKNPDSIFLTCMQSGAVNELTKTMIELGIPRETSLYLYDNLFKATKLKNNDEKESESKIRRVLQSNINKLPYWIKVQLEFLI